MYQICHQDLVPVGKEISCLIHQKVDPCQKSRRLSEQLQQIQTDFKTHEDLEAFAYRWAISKAKEGENKTTDIAVVSIRECI